MEYSKSMLKIYETLVRSPFRDFSIEELIQISGSGRTSGFSAVKILEEKNMILFKNIGRQRIIRLNINDIAFGYKFFLDSFGIRTMKQDVFFVIRLFSFYMSKAQIAECVFLFGSAASNKKTPGDIDFHVVLSDDSNKSREKIIKIREVIELICDYSINIHYSKKSDFNDLFEESIVYFKNTYFDFFISSENEKLKKKYSDCLENLNSLWNNVSDDSLFNDIMDRLTLNLSFCFAGLYNKDAKIKDEAVSEFMKKYKNRIKIVSKRDNISKFNLFKDIANEIGQEIFR